MPQGTDYRVQQAAPRERGWTQAARLAGGATDGCPARAGMDPHRSGEQRTVKRLPRASGDGPSGRSSLASGETAAPRERGWTLSTLGTSLSALGCPARAGMDPLVAAVRIGADGLPRASGDGPRRSLNSATHGGAAPRERGWTRWSEYRYAPSQGCPARAGMDPSALAPCVEAGGLPRASGDGPVTAAMAIGHGRAAPRERGWTQFHPDDGRTSQGCPARAGMDPSDSSASSFSSWLPRASGDGPWRTRGSVTTEQAAPRERGWTLASSEVGQALFGCPARAGMDPVPFEPPPAATRLPRASGDGPSAPDSTAVVAEAAPRERG